MKIEVRTEISSSLLSPVPGSTLPPLLLGLWLFLFDTPLQFRQDVTGIQG